MNEDKQQPVLTESIPTNPTESLPNDEEKSRLSYDQRRLSLLNNPIYGVILIFLDKFRSFIDIQEYPLHLLEENLLSDEDNISRRLIDFHFNLLKRISLGKGAQREKFVAIITKFAYRFDFDDGEYLRIHGYSRADIDIKLRIVKNLLETQFDHNTAFKSAVLEKPSFEIRSQAFGRDRSGASYWLILDAECFMRLFRENIDEDRTWTNIAKDKDELENFIQLLITDKVVRKKFSEWKFTYEPFNALELSNEFHDRYMPILPEIKKEEIKPIEHRAKSPIITLKKERISVPVPVTSIKDEIHSDEESTNSHEKISQRSSDETNLNLPTQEINNNQEDKQLETTIKKSARGRRKSKKRKSKSKARTNSNVPKKEEVEVEAEQITTPVVTKGRKRKQIVNDMNETIQDMKKNDETSQDKDMNSIAIDEELLQDDSLPIALRRSRRTRKPPPTIQSSSVTSSPVKIVSSSPTKKKISNGKSKISSQQTKIKSRKGRRGRRRANGSSDDDEHQPSDEEDEYNSDDYLPDPKQTDELNEDELLEVEEDDDEYVPRRSAKTVAKRRGQMTENNLTDDLSSASSECRVCSKSDRPEALLLCDDCDDPYHLECLKPSLLSVPDGDWFCPLCEHKRLCDNLIDKFQQFLKDYDELQAKKNQCMSKRSNRLANVMLNLDRMMKRSSKKRNTNGIVYSDEEEEEEEEKEEEEEQEEQDDDDEDSVYGFKDDGSIDGAEKLKRSSNTARSRRENRYSDEPQVLGVRSCRRKPQNYRFDDYDKKMREAMMVDGEDLDKESNESDENEANNDDDDNGSRSASKKRSGYEKDEDFDVSNRKKDDEFAPDQNNSDDSASEDEDEDYEDEESSDDKWKSNRRTSTRKKQPTRASTRRKSKKNSDDDDSLSDTELENLQSFNTTNETDYLSDDRRRSSRATTQRNYAKDDDDSDEDYFENGRPPPRRMRYKKRRGSDDSFVDDDDDYEKIAQKRKIVKYGKSLHRSSITDRIRKLVDDDDDDDEENENSTANKMQSQDEMQVDEKQTNNQKETEENQEQQQQKPSDDDDDDFPDEQEIFQANGLRKLQNTLIVPESPAIRPAFPAPTHSYQHAIVDPTARFAMIRPPVRPNGYPSNGHELTQQPSDSNQVNGHNSPTSSNFIIQDL